MTTATKVTKGQVEKSLDAVEQHPITASVKRVRRALAKAEVRGQTGVNLTADEKTKLDAMELRVLKAQSSFVELIDGLSEIQTFLDGKDGFRMNAYAQDRFDIAGATWSRYQDAMTIFGVFRKAGVPLPANEGQTRAIARVFKKKGEKETLGLWRRVSKKGRLTAQTIAEEAGDEPASEGRVTSPEKQLGQMEFRANKIEGRYFAITTRCEDANPEYPDSLKSLCGCQSRTIDSKFHIYEFTDFSEEPAAVLAKIAKWVSRPGVKSVQINLVEK